MSTNFHLYQQGTSPVHLGKRYGAGVSQTGWLTDASHGVFGDTLDLIAHLLRARQGAFVLDEYGNILTPAEMAAIIKEAAEESTAYYEFT